MALGILPLIIVYERKLLGRFQGRYGPNRVGPFGLLQPLAEIVKFATKEDSRPVTSVGPLYLARAGDLDHRGGRGASRWCPFGDDPHIFGTRVGLYGVDPSIGPLYVFAFGAIAFYGLMLGGWASGSKYSFLGAMRAAAQLISYEVSQGLALIGVVITAGSLSLTADRPRPGRHVVLHPAVRRLPRSSRSRASPRPTARRSTSSRPTPSWSPATSPSTAARAWSPSCSPST